MILITINLARDSVPNVLRCDPCYTLRSRGPTIFPAALLGIHIKSLLTELLKAAYFQRNDIKNSLLKGNNCLIVSYKITARLREFICPLANQKIIDPQFNRFKNYFFQIQLLYRPGTDFPVCALPHTRERHGGSHWAPA